MKITNWKDERGVSLVIALLTMVIISLLAAGIIFVSRTETATTANYKQLASIAQRIRSRHCKG